MTKKPAHWFPNGRAEGLHFFGRAEAQQIDAGFQNAAREVHERDVAGFFLLVGLMDLTRRVLETCIDLLGFSAPEKM